MRKTLNVKKKIMRNKSKSPVIVVGYAGDVTVGNLSVLKVQTIT